MGRSGYNEDYDEDYNNAIWLYRQAVERAINGKRGQAFLREMLAALDAMPDKRLIDESLIDETGSVCAIGSVGRARGIDMANLDEYDQGEIAKTFGIAKSMAAEIAYENDEGVGSHNETPEHRWTRVREWVAAQIRVDL